MTLIENPPPDEREFHSDATLSQRRSNPASEPMFAPLLGTTPTEKQGIREDLIRKGAVLIPLNEWKAMLVDQKICTKAEVLQTGFPKLNLWLTTCIPEYLLPERAQWPHLWWLMISPPPGSTSSTSTLTKPKPKRATEIINEEHNAP
jgi:hypothetical protein